MPPCLFIFRASHDACNKRALDTQTDRDRERLLSLSSRTRTEDGGRRDRTKCAAAVSKTEHGAKVEARLRPSRRQWRSVFVIFLVVVCCFGSDPPFRTRREGGHSDMTLRNCNGGTDARNRSNLPASPALYIFTGCIQRIVPEQEQVRLSWPAPGGLGLTQICTTLLWWNFIHLQSCKSRC